MSASARRRHFGFAWRDGPDTCVRAYVRVTPAIHVLLRFRERVTEKEKRLFVYSCTSCILVIKAIHLYIVYKLPLWRDPCVSRIPWHSCFFLSLSFPFSFLLTFLSPLPSPPISVTPTRLSIVFPALPRISRCSPFPPSFFLSLLPCH